VIKPIKPIRFLEPMLSIQINEEHVNITFMDSYNEVCSLNVGHREFNQALGRLSCVPCLDADVRPEVAGKIMEHKPFEFQIDLTGVSYKRKRVVTRVKALELCPDGWYPDTHFGSQESFFERDGEQWARTTIRRFVFPHETEEKSAEK
jgi:hypothetical protein